MQMGLDFGFNSFEGISDAFLGVKFLLSYHRKYLVPFCYCGKPEEDQISIIAIDSGVILDEHIFLKTRNGEKVVFKLNCRESLTMSAAPLYLQIKARKDEDVGDVAIIKFPLCSGPSPTICFAECEGLVLRKFLISFMGV